MNMRDKEREKRSKDVPVYETMLTGGFYGTDDNDNIIMIEPVHAVYIATKLKKVVCKSKLRYVK